LSVVDFTVTSSVFASTVATGYDEPAVTEYALLDVIPQVPLVETQGWVADVGNALELLDATNVA
jgi:hypothetical protein